MSKDRHEEDRQSEYVAWDGNNYPGDPPEGWYLANDNRWWPSEQIINDSNGYADPYKKAYLDDDEAYGQEYQHDPSFAEPEPTNASEASRPQTVSEAPSIESLPEPTFDPPIAPSNAAPPRLELRMPEPDQSVAPAGPPPPRRVGFGGNTRQRQAPAPTRRRQRGRGISIIIFAAIALARCASGIGDDDSNNTPINVPTSPPTIAPSEDGLTEEGISEEGFGVPKTSPYIDTPGLTIDFDILTAIESGPTDGTVALDPTYINIIQIGELR